MMLLTFLQSKISFFFMTHTKTKPNLFSMARPNEALFSVTCIVPHSEVLPMPVFLQL